MAYRMIGERGLVTHFSRLLVHLVTLAVLLSGRLLLTMIHIKLDTRPLVVKSAIFTASRIVLLTGGQ